ncbi:HNH endonuclease signature motif containing protein [Pseudokineococcus lusitanus]|uniref:Uncharacterized protein DUF222 n=1 Tax=Pseudokineococcus lusitanus TaxID=763993 RepID=A0A3N1GWX7_9ACTN|nr:uncharacterized protein DUF222 [Pseudokineococcus lusitanus]
MLGLVADLVDETAASLGVPVGGDPVETARFGRLGGDPAEAVITEIALALRVGVAGARRLVTDALALTTVLPETRAALSAGTVGAGQAHAVVAETAGLTSEQARWVDAEVADDLPRLDPRGITRKVRALVARLEVDATNRRVRYETCRRRVLVQPLGDGAAELVATGPVADITALFHRLTTWARTRTGPNAAADPHAAVAAGLDPVTTDTTGLPDQRGVDARRFDALVGLATDTGAGLREDGRAHAGQCHGPQLNVSLPTLLGLDDEQAWLAGHGAVPADVARELLAAGHSYRRILTDPWTGTVLGVDGHLHHLPATTTRTTPKALDSTSTGALGTFRAATDSDPATTPGVGVPGWAGRGPSLPEDRPPGRPPCPLAGLPTGYVPTAEQSRYVRAALPECTHPGCTQPSVRCDLDHQVPHGAGGPTCECNLRPRCRKHHQCRTHYGWQVEAITDDPADPYGLGTRWTSPLGLVHDDPAPPFLPRPVTSRDADGTPLPAGWGDRGEPLDCSYPAVDMAWPGALALEAAVTATIHHRRPPQPPPHPVEDDDPPPF